MLAGESVDVPPDGRGVLQQAPGLHDLAARAASQLQAWANDLRQRAVSPCPEFRIPGNDLKKEADAFAGQHQLTQRTVPSVYILDFENAEKAARAWDAYESARVLAPGRALSPRNPYAPDATCLYVGKCAKGGISSRLRAHLGLGSERTGALHLRFWLPPTCFPILVKVVRCDGAQPAMIEAMEKVLWDDRRPLFGRGGT